MAAARINRVLKDPNERDRVFKRINGSNSGALSQAQIEDFVKEEYGQEIHTEALALAHKAADVTKDDRIDRREFFKCVIVCGLRGARSVRACCCLRAHCVRAGC